MCGSGTDQLGGDGRRQHGPGGAARAAGDLSEHGLHEPDQEVQAAVFFLLPVLRIVAVFLAAAPVGGAGTRQIADPGTGVRGYDDGVGVAAPGSAEGTERKGGVQVAMGGGSGGVEAVR
jgi:hypothetical protein